MVSAGSQTTGFKVAINPSKIVDAENVFEKISSIITIDHDDFTAKANKTKDIYEEIAHRLTKEEADALSLLKISGVSIYKEKWRSYPGGNMASHSLGFVAYKGDELAGRYGLERQYNTTLSRSKDNPYVNFFAEVFSNINKNLFNEELKEGDIVTTIEPSVQSFLEQELSQVKSRYQIDSIGGIIMNPKDGAIWTRAHAVLLGCLCVGGLACEDDVISRAEPKLRIAPEHIDFGTLELGQDSAKAVTIENLEQVPGTIESARIVDDCGGCFIAVATPTEVPATSSVALPIRFRAVRLAVATGTVTIATSDPGLPS
ncbi:MAG: choice-of-anchor D domain-containing protein, partial [Patescibacteria group bacterium]